MRPRFLFHNEALQLLAFSLHKSGVNLPEIHPLRPWRAMEDPDDLNVIYEWGPDTLHDFSRELRRNGCYLFHPKTQPRARG